VEEQGVTSDSTISTSGIIQSTQLVAGFQWCKRPTRRKWRAGRDRYSDQGQVGIALSCGIELRRMRMNKKRQMANLEREVLDVVESFYALAASACRLW